VVRSRNFVYPLLNIIEDKVPVDVATSLVVNHVNTGVLYWSILCLCLCLWLSNKSGKYLHMLRVWITVKYLCMNAKLLQLCSVCS
jgi:hypothetical protein